MTPEEMERKLLQLEREVRVLRDALHLYELRGLQVARFRPLDEVYAAADHTH